MYWRLHAALLLDCQALTKLCVVLKEGEELPGARVFTNSVDEMFGWKASERENTPAQIHT